jgi:type IV secretion system protein TrbL
VISTVTVLPDALTEVCKLLVAKNLPACVVGNAAGDVAGAAATAIQFGTDPLGYIGQQLQFAAAGLAKAVLGGLTNITHPDLGQAWFTGSYAVSFGMAIFVLVILLAVQLVQLARRQVSGEEVTSTFSFYVPTFFFGSLFGPMLGTLLVSLTGALGESLVSWGISSNAEATTKNLIGSIAAGSAIVAEFGAVTAIVLYLCMIVALLLTFLVLLVIVVTLYLTGVLIPLSLVWLTSPTQRHRGLRLVSVWLGLNFSHVLIFLLLGFAFRMVNGLTITAPGAGLQGLANLALAAITLFAVTLSPFTFMKIGNAVLPSNGPDSGGRPSLPSAPSGVGNLLQQTAHDSQAAQRSRSNPSPAETEASPGGGSGEAGKNSGGSRDGPSLTDRVKARSGGSSVSGIEAGEGSPIKGNSAPSGGPGGGPGVGSGGLTKAAVPKMPPSTAAAGGGGAGGAAGAATAAEGAGAAASATGIGAFAGVPLIAAGVALSAASNAVSYIGELADTATDITTDQMKHGGDDGQGEPRPQRKV